MTNSQSGIFLYAIMSHYSDSDFRCNESVIPNKKQLFYVAAY